MEWMVRYDETVNLLGRVKENRNLSVIVVTKGYEDVEVLQTLESRCESYRKITRIRSAVPMGRAI